jgi:cyclic beta-1,2-glucan synthetase
MYRAGMEAILGLRLKGDTLSIAPCIPKGWPRYDVSFGYRSARYEIAVENPQGVNRRLVELQLDGQALPAEHGRVPLVDDGATHRVRAVLG